MHVSPVPRTTDTNQNSSLTPGFKQRHVTIISIAGGIGAGLFVASRRAIAATGPASILAYLVAGLLVVLVMRMLGEMALLLPTRAPSRPTPPARSDLGRIHNWRDVDIKKTPSSG
jgi:amino acid permease